MTRVRRADASDAAEIARVHLAARAAAGTSFPPPVHPDSDLLPHVLDDLLPTREVWVTPPAGPLTAVLALDDDGIDWLYVEPAAQSTGIGSALIEHAKALRPTGLGLWVFVSNTRARRFYEHRGFTIVGGTDGDNEEGAPDLRYRWPGV